MKSKKKIALIAVAATLVMGITVFAASGIISQWFSSSSSVPDYKTLPTPEEVVKDIGYEAVTIDEFANGYKFDNGSVVDNVLTDDNGKAVEKFKSVTFRYLKDNEQTAKWFQMLTVLMCIITATLTNLFPLITK